LKPINDEKADGGVENENRENLYDGIDRKRGWLGRPRDGMNRKERGKSKKRDLRDRQLLYF